MQSDEEFVSYLSPDLKKLNDERLKDDDSYDKWVPLIEGVEAQENGIGRNSSPQAIDAFRGVYDRFLAKFPLFFGYWIKYATLEFSISGTEASDLVYERGLACIPMSVDLWNAYCTFKAETTHDPEPVRQLYQRAAQVIGIDFMAHPFWEQYLEFEESHENHPEVVAVLSRIVRIPMHQYAKFYDRFCKLSQHTPARDLVPSDTYAQFKAEFEMSNQDEHNEQHLEAAIRPRVEEYYSNIFAKTQAEANKRWGFEQQLKRQYFHVTDMDEDQLDVWRRYLDFEEREGDHKRIKFLYERCVIPLASYEEFWLRYVRWMIGQRTAAVVNKYAEETRHIFLRACCYFVPIAHPQIRLQWALFEEREGRYKVAADIYEAVVTKTSDLPDVILAWANLCRRKYGMRDTIGFYQGYIVSENLISTDTKLLLIGEFVKLLANIQKKPEDARSVLEEHAGRFANNMDFFRLFLDFEMGQADLTGDRLPARKLTDAIRKSSSLKPEEVEELMSIYMHWLLNSGGDAEVGEWLDLDRLLNAPAYSG